MKKIMQEIILIKVFYLAMILTALLVGCATMTPLTQASKDGDLATIDKLLREGANINEANPGRAGTTALGWALQYCKFDTASSLLTKGANVNLTNSEGTPIWFAAFSCGNMESSFTKRLLEQVADVNIRDKQGYLVLSYCNYQNEDDFDKVSKLLIDKGLNVNSKEGIDSPLIYAVGQNSPKVVKLLLDDGANINALGLWGTPLMHAARNNYPQVAKLLIERGADIHIYDKQGDRNAMAYTHYHDFKENSVANVLRNADSIRQQYLANTRNNDAITAKLSVNPIEESTLTINTDAYQQPSKEAVKHNAYGRYYAFIIGNNKYAYLPRLQTANNDAITLAGILKNYYGFDVTLLLDAKRSDILMAIGKFRKMLTIQDNLLIYYAGHGWLDKDGDEGYWLPVDATKDNDVNWISNSSITTHLKAMEAKHVLIIADSCFSGKLGRGIHIEKRTPDYYARISNKRARSVLSSGGLEPVIDSGGKGNHSVFATAFIEALQENKNIIDTSELFNKIRRPIVLNADQTPEYADIRKAGHDGGEFIFVKKK